MQVWHRWKQKWWEGGPGLGRGSLDCRFRFIVLANSSGSFRAKTACWRSPTVSRNAQGPGFLLCLLMWLLRKSVLPAPETTSRGPWMPGGWQLPATCTAHSWTVCSLWKIQVLYFLYLLNYLITTSLSAYCIVVVIIKTTWLQFSDTCDQRNSN